MDLEYLFAFAKRRSINDIYFHEHPKPAKLSLEFSLIHVIGRKRGQDRTRDLHTLHSSVIRIFGG